MYAFTYHQPKTVAEAAGLAASFEDGKVLAGGQTLLPTMKQRLASPAQIVDLSHIAELSGIALSGDHLVIKAMTRHVDVANSVLVKQHIPALAHLAEGIGDPQVRNRGTIGGSIANNDPAADYPAACLGLGATIETTKRKITADDFFTGMFSTALEEGELITAVHFPLTKTAAYAKFPNPASRYAIVGVFVAKTGSGVRVAVTGAGSDGVFRESAMEKALAANFVPSALDGIKVDAGQLNADMHADADYRAHLVSVMAKRAVASANAH